MKNQNINRENSTLLSILFSFFLFIILTNEAGLLITLLITVFVFGLFIFKQMISKVIVEEETPSKNLRRLS